MDCEELYSAGSLVGAIIGTFIATLILLGFIWFIFEMMKKRKLRKSGLSNLVLMEDGLGEKSTSYDNPGFVAEDSQDSKGNHKESGDTTKLNGAGKQVSKEGEKKAPWGPFRFFFKTRKALDDSVIEEPQRYSVALKGHDFTGLGFNICGNMKDGIFVKDVMQRGPAAESKHILPGDQITSMTVSFKHMVLEDAITLLSYASPYEVSMEMMRHADKSLSHRGLLVLSPSHPSGSGQTNSLDRVCHPFFRSQSIDDLRKVGKEHLDQQVSRSKKQANGVHGKHASGASTMELPTVVVVGNNETRGSSSPHHQAKLAVTTPATRNFQASAISQKAHQHTGMSVAADEVDSPIVPKMKVSAKTSKPELIPRAKSKVSNVQKASSETVVEAISPVVKMSEEFEKMVEEQSLQPKTLATASSPDAAVVDVQSMSVNISGPSVKAEQVEIDMPDFPDGVNKLDEKIPSMITMSEQSEMTKAPDMELAIGGPEIAIGTEKETHVEDKDAEISVKKPQRGQKLKKDKGKEKESKQPKQNKDKKEKEQTGQEDETTEKSKFGKFGFGINLPDLSLNFGKGHSSGDKDKSKDKEDIEDNRENNDETKMSETKEQHLKLDAKPKAEPKDKPPKGKEKSREMSPKKGKTESVPKTEDESSKEPEPGTDEHPEKKQLEKSSSSGFGFHLKFPSFDKPILRRRDSSSSSNGDAADKEPIVDNDPHPQPAEKTKKSRSRSPNKKSNKDAKKGKTSRPTSPTEKSDTEQPTGTDNNGEGIVRAKSPGSESAAGDEASAEKSSTKRGFHMPHLGIKLPKFGHSKHSYSFENDGSGKDGRHGYMSEIPKYEEDSPSVSVKMESGGGSKVSVENLQGKTEGKEELEMKASSSPPADTQGKIEGTSPSGTSGLSYGLYPPGMEEESSERAALSSSPIESAEAGSKSEKPSDNKPGLVSKGLKGLRELKDKVTGKLSHDHHASEDSDEEVEAADELSSKAAAKEKAKRDKKSAKEAREKANLEAKREKERLKAEKKAKKAELKAAKKAAADQSSDSSSSSSSDESDAEEEMKKGKEKKRGKSKDKSKTKKDKKSSKPGKKVESEGKEMTEIEMKKMSENLQGQSPETVPSVTSDNKEHKQEKPPVVPRKKDRSKKGEEKSGKESTPTKDSGKTKEKKARKDKGDSSSSSSSSSSESDSEVDTSKNEDKQKKPRKRKAPIPPVPEDSSTKLVTTSAQVTSPPSNSEVHSKSPEGEGRRCASVGDLSTLQGKSKASPVDSLERAMSMDMTADSPVSQSTTIPVGSPLEDLSAEPDSKTVIPHLNKQSQKRPASTLSSSSSSETLKDSPASVVNVVHKEASVSVGGQPASSHNIVVGGISVDSPSEAQVLKKMSESLSSMDSPSLVKAVEGVKSQQSVTMDDSLDECSTKVTISTSGTSALHPSEVESVARETVDEILSQVNDSSSLEKIENLRRERVEGEGDTGETSSSRSQVVVQTHIQGPDSTTATGKNVTIMSVKNVAEQDLNNESKATSTSAPLLREDSKTRLMQTVADANNIKINPISLRKDSSMSSSSSSVDSSPEVRSDSKSAFSQKAASSGDATGKSSDPVAADPSKETIEISPEELDGVMMSHAEFLHKQATSKGAASDDKPKDSSFDNWIYVEQKNAAHELSCSHSHSDPEPSTSSNDDEDLPYNRNGALSPASAYKMETEYKYETSEMRVTSSPVPPADSSGGNNASTTTVYSTTMTLPQKTVTQITLGEPAVDAGGRIVSKITLESPTEAESDLPTLKPTK